MPGNFISPNRSLVDLTKKKEACCMDSLMVNMRRTEKFS